MASINSFADLLRDWEGLLGACRDNSADLASAEPQRAALEAILLTGRELKARQESHKAQGQRTTQELKTLTGQGKEAARRLRGAVKANLGTDNERLVQFKVAPIRKRGARVKFIVKPPEESPGGAAPSPPDSKPVA